MLSCPPQSGHLHSTEHSHSFFHAFKISTYTSSFRDLFSLCARLSNRPVYTRVKFFRSFDVRDDVLAKRTADDARCEQFIRDSRKRLNESCDLQLVRESSKRLDESCSIKFVRNLAVFIMHC